MYARYANIGLNLQERKPYLTVLVTCVISKMMTFMAVKLVDSTIASYHLAVEHCAHDSSKREISFRCSSQGASLIAPSRTLCQSVAYCVDGSTSMVADGSRLLICHAMQVLSETFVSGELLHQPVGQSPVSRSL